MSLSASPRMMLRNSRAFIPPFMKAAQFVPKSLQQTSFIGGLSAPSHLHALVCSSCLPAWCLHSGPQVRWAEPADLCLGSTCTDVNSGWEKILKSFHLIQLRLTWLTRPVEDEWFAFLMQPASRGRSTQLRCKSSSEEGNCS